MIPNGAAGLGLSTAGRPYRTLKAGRRPYLVRFIPLSIAILIVSLLVPALAPEGAAAAGVPTLTIPTPACGSQEFPTTSFPWLIPTGGVPVESNGPWDRGNRS